MHGSSWLSCCAALLAFHALYCTEPQHCSTNCFRLMARPATVHLIWLECLVTMTFCGNFGWYVLRELS